MAWADRLAVLTELNAEKGQVTTVKITLIGRPGRIVERGACIVTSMESSKSSCSSKGLTRANITIDLLHGLHRGQAVAQSCGRTQGPGRCADCRRLPALRYGGQGDRRVRHEYHHQESPGGAAPK